MKAKSDENQINRRRDRIQKLGCIACARLGNHDRTALLYQVDPKDPQAAIPLCDFHIHGWAGVHANPRTFEYGNGAPAALLREVNAWLDYEDGISPHVSPRNPFTRKNICIYE